MPWDALRCRKWHGRCRPTVCCLLFMWEEECESDYCIPPASLIWAAAECRFAACQVASSRPTWQRRCVLLHASVEVKACLVFRNSRLMCQCCSALLFAFLLQFSLSGEEKRCRVLISPHISFYANHALIPVRYHSHTLLIAMQNDWWQSERNRMQIVLCENIKRKN